MIFNTRYEAQYNPVEWYKKQFDPLYQQVYRHNAVEPSYIGAYDSPLKLSADPMEKSVFAPLDEHDPLYSFFESKRKILSGGVSDVTGLIQERKDIKTQNLYGIEYDICKVITKLYELDHWPPETNFSVERKRANFEKELLDFEREKRMEEVACWRDVTRLRGELRELKGKVYEEQRRQQLIRGE